MKNNTPNHDPVADIVNAINAAANAGVNPAFIVTTLEVAKMDIINAMQRVNPHPEKPSILKSNS